MIKSNSLKVTITVILKTLIVIILKALRIFARYTTDGDSKNIENIVNKVK